MNESGIVLRPIEGKWFHVNPLELDFDFLKYPRKNIRQEEIRLLINEAVNELSKNPERYNRPFETLIPQYNVCGGKTIMELKIFSQSIGDSIANWVEQSLEWLQRINNGETWEDICFKSDQMKNYRLIEWKNGTIHFVGGALTSRFRSPATNIGTTDWHLKDKVFHAVPLIIKYK